MIEDLLLDTSQTHGSHLCTIRLAYRLLRHRLFLDFQTHESQSIIDELSRVLGTVTFVPNGAVEATSISC